nr:uncharacterized protein LOC116282589 [Vicugna pacos]
MVDSRLALDKGSFIEKEGAQIRGGRPFAALQFLVGEGLGRGCIVCFYSSRGPPQLLDGRLYVESKASPGRLDQDTDNTFCIQKGAPRLQNLERPEQGPLPGPARPIAPELLGRPRRFGPRQLESLEKRRQILPAAPLWANPRAAKGPGGGRSIGSKRKHLRLQPSPRLSRRGSGSKMAAVPPGRLRLLRKASAFLDFFQRVSGN